MARFESKFIIGKILIDKIQSTLVHLKLQRIHVGKLRGFYLEEDDVFKKLSLKSFVVEDKVTDLSRLWMCGILGYQTFELWRHLLVLKTESMELQLPLTSVIDRTIGWT